MNLVETRAVAYDALFRGELPYLTQPSQTDIGVAGLWRAHTVKRGQNGEELNLHLGSVHDAVESILTEHNQRAIHNDGESEAVFSLINKTETLSVVIDVTSQAVSLWEKALYRNHEAPLLNIDKDKATDTPNGNGRLVHTLASKSLVIETAAAVLHVMPIFLNDTNPPIKIRNEGLAKIIANWGPQFIVEWMDGSILEQWLAQQDASVGKFEEWEDIFTPGILKHFALNNVSDPLGALDRVKTNLLQMTDERIAGHLGWATREVRIRFCPSLRKYFAVRNISDPLAGISAYVAGEINGPSGYFHPAENIPAYA